MSGEARPAASALDEVSCWVLSDGKAGTENQCIGLAEAIGCRFAVKRVRACAPWRHLPTGVWLRLVGDRPHRFLARDGDRLAPPWPDLLIAAGRASVPYAAAVRRAAAQAGAPGGPTFAVQLQNPRVPLRLFDLVVAPRHDRLGGANVITTLGAPNRITPARLRHAAARFENLVEHLPRPRVAVLVGGASRAYRVTASDFDRLAENLLRLTRRGAALMVTPSRRTGAARKAQLGNALRDAPAVVWDGAGDNPYLGFLGLADAIVVTADSVSMTSEACATGKPVFVAGLDGGNARFRRFHAALEEGGYTRPFAGELGGSGKRLADTGAVAEAVRRRLADTPS